MNDHPARKAHFGRWLAVAYVVVGVLLFAGGDLILAGLCLLMAGICALLD